MHLEISEVRACIVGIGNELRRDDGAGLEIVRRLQTAGMSRVYDLIPLGQNILELASIIEVHHKTIIIDALPAGEPAGEIFIGDWQQWFTKVRESFSLHDLDLFDQINLAKKRGSKVNVTLIGVVTFDLGFGYGLSKELQRCLNDVVNKIQKWLFSDVGY